MSTHISDLLLQMQAYFFMSIKGNLSCQLLSDRPSVMLESLLKYNQYLKNLSNLKQFFV